ADILIRAIETVNQQIEGHEDSDVINVFVAPEFYFHGVYGPYIWNSKTAPDPILYLENYLRSKL
ncbi:hypothetical protein, partial [Facilibium subflavum]|uniref:hypothetical protein n=1 Tax=Facilibium subflavum TaxID=2219058 RepID=UPI001AAD2FBE